MEMQYKERSYGHMENGGGARRTRTDLMVRFLALGLTLAAAVVLGLNKQTTTVNVTIAPTLPPVSLPVTAKWLHMSAMVYFVIVNAIVCSYTTVSLILTLVTKNGNKNVSLMIAILDLVMVALLFSAIGATGAVGLIGYKGNSHVQWGKVCDVFDKFCHRVAVSMVLSFLGSMAYVLLAVLATFNAYTKF
ncbi:hypothetical protein OSB04_022037 [Centaurea solstitialis]|uniref:CASP-like protein n=1 Tax=Centaurea solstitialis TaxID=347529 RepID=A0AA38SVB9_9ASTR|nr:hypothetical protein OSB04_022037 [Centaurea solstitialis]